MKYLFIVAVLFSFFSEINAQVTLLNADEVQEIIKQKEVELIDVRTVEEFNENYIEGAHNLIYDEDFEEKVKHLDPSKTIVVYCQSGNRSQECTRLMQDFGFLKIIELEGGLEQWMLEGKPTQSNEGDAIQNHPKSN